MHVLELFMYSQLRLEDTSMHAAEIAQNVSQVVELVHLLGERDVKTKDLSRGCRRRLSIAEEVGCLWCCMMR
jgi:ABC-type multidrug transport system ATPase subunit